MGMKDKFKATESTLYKYNEILTEIKCIKISIKNLEEDFKGCGAITYDNEIKGGNGFNSVVENEAIEREKKVVSLKRSLAHKEELIEKINSVIESLSDEERELVELRYTNRNTRSWEEISYLLKFSLGYCKNKLRSKVINKFKNVIFM